MTQCEHETYSEEAINGKHFLQCSNRAAKTLSRKAWNNGAGIMIVRYLCDNHFTEYMQETDEFMVQKDITNMMPPPD